MIIPDNFVLGPKKYYTWDEIRDMPFGTKFRLKGWIAEFLFAREKDGTISHTCITEKSLDGVPLGEESHWSLLCQDRFEIIEEPKPEREYVDGLDALRKLMTGEWEKIACDDPDWNAEFIEEKDGQLVPNAGYYIGGCAGPKFLKLKRWYEVKD